MAKKTNRNIIYNVTGRKKKRLQSGRVLPKHLHEELLARTDAHTLTELADQITKADPDPKGGLRHVTLSRALAGKRISRSNISRIERFLGATNAR